MFPCEIDYKKLNSGGGEPKVCQHSHRQKTWAASKLFELAIIDSKTLDGLSFVKVHYLDKEWDSPKFDKWREADDIIDIPQCLIVSTSEIEAVLTQQLKTNIKESLHGQRKVDSIVNIELPVPRDFFNIFAAIGRKINNLFSLESISSFDGVLGRGWNWRVFNSQGDFAFVTPGTITYRLKSRPLEQYSPEGALQLIYRGFVFHLKFARGMGNKYDFALFVR